MVGAATASVRCWVPVRVWGWAVGALQGRPRVVQVGALGEGAMDQAGKTAQDMHSKCSEGSCTLVGSSASLSLPYWP